MMRQEPPAIDWLEHCADTFAGASLLGVVRRRSSQICALTTPRFPDPANARILTMRAALLEAWTLANSARTGGAPTR